jgi:hypothetical protein
LSSGLIPTFELKGILTPQHAHKYYNYNELFLELESICRFEDESFEDFLSRFRMICFRFLFREKNSAQDLMEGFLYLFYLPCIEKRDTIDVCNDQLVRIEDIDP